ncbi:MAG: AAA family ATPase [Rhizobiaceae bacterium]
MAKRAQGKPSSTNGGGHAALPPEMLRRTTDPAILSSAAELPPNGLIGQSRALDALDLGTSIPGSGFNIFVMGPRGSGRHRAVNSLLQARAGGEKPPDDWIYVANFTTPHRPHAIRMPPGSAVSFRDAMEELLGDLGVAIPATFEAEEYKSRAGAIVREMEEAHENLFGDLNRKARELNVAVMRTPMGFAFVPQKEGETLKPEDFEKLDTDEQKRIQDQINLLQGELKSILEKLPGMEKARRDRMRALNQEMASRAVTAEIAEVAETFSSIEGIAKFLENVSRDVIKNVQVFMEAEEAAQKAPLPVAGLISARDPRLRQYGVNVIVGEEDGDGRGAPVVVETNPTYRNLIGHIEHISQMGALVTDFTLIKSGALHRANGGYLVVDARQLLMQPGAWEALKRVLKDGEIRVTSLGEQFSLVSTVSLDPDPIPLSVKVVLIGDRMIYYMLHALDPDFASLFKVSADFDDDIDRTDDAARQYAAMIATIAEREKLATLSPDGLARMIDETARFAADAEKLSLQVETVTDILREADHWARDGGGDRIGADAIARTIAERRRRAGRLRERMHEAVTRDIVLIDTSGEAVGQVNGLSVLSPGDQRFGTAARITARVRMGAGKLVDIEREVKLGGPLHSKGILILSGFLSARYALDAPMALWASLVFEQSYGGVDGDSASSAELYALLSALSGVAIDQSFAVTGSVNQMGEVQAIGGVNEKIEGFFDICSARGLTGRQGVLIPAANTRHLMLREDAVEACAKGRFAVHAVGSIDEGIAILTGRPAGERDAGGSFPEGSINGLVEARLREFADMRRRYGAARDDGAGAAPADGGAS